MQAATPSETGNRRSKRPSLDNRWVENLRKNAKGQKPRFTVHRPSSTGPGSLSATALVSVKVHGGNGILCS
ncbi:hypothetical protein AXF42_Ash017111 [Apostasia shenzhenica]|uniref:Uncharacterized protein n=1 Tax=Apostasia shenzhenica TaxID=1088818 RepID=A0A2H9ZV72_9ASPA|nr:hypothetical protein AXF42_Ash017111 [Apostasia shenzhenica]